MVPPFKAHAGSFLSSNQKGFNTLLAKPRVRSEHCIGRFKGRLPWLKGIRMEIGNKVQMDKVIAHVRGSVTLHNYLIDEPIDEAWMEGGEGEDDLAPEPIMARNSNEPDYKRRNELLFYLSELEETPLN